MLNIKTESKMETATQILEAKGYEGDEVDSILTWGTSEVESLDLQTRIEFGIYEHPVHLWEAYYVGDADEKELFKIAKEKGFEDVEDLLEATTHHLNSLAENYPAKND